MADYRKSGDLTDLSLKAQNCSVGGVVSGKASHKGGRHEHLRLIICQTISSLAPLIVSDWRNSREFVFLWCKEIERGRTLFLLYRRGRIGCDGILLRMEKRFGISWLRKKAGAGNFRLTPHQAVALGQPAHCDKDKVSHPSGLINPLSVLQKTTVNVLDTGVF